MQNAILYLITGEEAADFRGDPQEQTEPEAVEAETNSEVTQPPTAGEQPHRTAEAVSLHHFIRAPPDRQPSQEAKDGDRPLAIISGRTPTWKLFSTFLNFFKLIGHLMGDLVDRFTHGRQFRII